MTTKAELSFVSPRLKEAKNYIPPVFEKDICGLDMNYSMYGPSPNCKKILSKIDIDHFKEYPNAGNDLVESAVADSIGVNKDKVIVDNGSARIIELVFRMVLSAGDTMIYPNPGWDFYRSISNLLGVKCIQYNLEKMPDSYQYNCKIIQDCINQTSPKLVLITSPNMPTGNMILETDLEIMIKKNPEILIVVDEAYFGYADTELNISRLTDQYTNVVFIRTLSKLYGLASERVGFAIANSNFIELAKKISSLFGISYISQLLSKAVLEDRDYYQHVSKQTIVQRDRLKNKLELLGNYFVYQSSANFILVRVSDYDTFDLVEYVRRHGYAIRECGKGYNLAQHIRISIGTEKMTDDLITIFCEYDRINNIGFSDLVQG